MQKSSRHEDRGVEQYRWKKEEKNLFIFTGEKKEENNLIFLKKGNK